MKFYGVQLPAWVPAWGPWAVLGALGAGLLAAVWPGREGGGGGGSGGDGWGPQPEGDVDDWAPLHTTQAGECDLVAKPGVVTFRAWTIAAWGERPGSPQNILRDCSIGSPSEHWVGRGWDWMVPSMAAGDAMVDSLVGPGPSGEPAELARRAGVQYLIWNGRIWRSYDRPNLPRATWAPYTGAEGHADHVHLSFSTEGSMGETSLYPAIEAGYRWPGAPYPGEGVA